MHKSVSTILFEVVKQEINKTIPGLYFYNTKLLFIGFFLYVINISLLFLIIIFANISCSKICIRVFWMAIITRRVDTSIFITGIFNRCLGAQTMTDGSSFGPLFYISYIYIYDLLNNIGTSTSCIRKIVGECKGVVDILLRQSKKNLCKKGSVRGSNPPEPEPDPP